MSDGEKHIKRRNNPLILLISPVTLLHLWSGLSLVMWTIIALPLHQYRVLKEILKSDSEKYTLLLKRS